LWMVCGTCCDAGVWGVAANGWVVIESMPAIGARPAPAPVTGRLWGRLAGLPPVPPILAGAQAQARIRAREWVWVTAVDHGIRSGVYASTAKDRAALEADLRAQRARVAAELAGLCADVHAGRRRMTRLLLEEVRAAAGRLADLDAER
jgi:hypothetical protein